MARLAFILRVQAIAFLLYGVAFFFVPDFTMDTLFDWAGLDTLWVRGIGAAFLVLAWIEWRIADDVDSRLDLVWPFALAPALILVSLIWERAADTYAGSDLFFWVSIAVAAFFLLAVGGLRLAVRPTEVVPID